MKKIFYGLLILSAFIGGAFALFQDKIFIDVPEDVKKNLELRYGEEFEFIEYVEGENTENSRVMILKGDSGKFKLTRYYDSEGYVHYMDNYYAVKHYDEIKEIFDKAFYSIDKRLEYEIDLNTSTFPSETLAIMSFSEFLQDEKTVFDINVVSTPNWVDDDIQEFANRLQNSGAKANVKMLRCGEDLIKLSDFDSVMHSKESIGNKIFFSVGGNGEIFYINRE
ncbi:hypothetical protein ACEE21_14700 [Clostridium baratii]